MPRKCNECGQGVSYTRSGQEGRRCKDCWKNLTGYAFEDHGLQHTLEYNSWRAMKARCYQPKFHAYHRYGGRGITVCDRWLRSFGAFLTDVGPRPSQSHSLDRFPNKDGNYEPGNVRWATPEEQQRNRGDNFCVTFRGETKSISEWADRLGFSNSKILSKRIKLRGWSVDRALTTPAYGSLQC